MAVMGLLFPAVLHFTHTEVHFGSSELALSRFSSCIMLVAYAAYLVFQLKSQKNLYVPVDEVSALDAFQKSSLFFFFKYFSLISHISFIFCIWLVIYNHDPLIVLQHGIYFNDH